MAEKPEQTLPLVREKVSCIGTKAKNRGEEWSSPKETNFGAQEKTFGRAHGVIKIVETIASMDMLERRKIAKELTWRAKWNARRAKISARTRKRSQPFQETRTALQLKG